MNLQGRLARARANGERLFRAPGRVNIIGEHTDYSGGLVLPTNTGLYTWVTAKGRADRTVRIQAPGLGDTGKFELDDIEPSSEPGWIDYAKGVARMLEEEGVTLTGVELSIAGEIPIGAGLSSSASLELALASAMLGIAGVSLPAEQVAEACQRAEQRFAAVNCGIMDQFSVACCRENHAMKLDCRSLHAEFVPLPKRLTILVTDSGAKHRLPESGYNDRHEECRQAVQRLREADSSIEVLRDASPELIDRESRHLGDRLYRRARHVVTEIQRVRDAFAALAASDLESLGALILESHRSLRDDFEISCDEIETLVHVATGCDTVLGSRMVGGGFGGCVLSIVHRDDADNAFRHIRDEYARLIGHEPWIHVVSPAHTAEEVTAG